MNMNWEDLSRDKKFLDYWAGRNEAMNAYIASDIKVTEEFVKGGIDMNRKALNSMPRIKKVMYRDGYTIVFWNDKTKTIVKCQEGDTFDPEKGLAMAFIKRVYGNKGKYYDMFKRWSPKRGEALPNVQSR